MNKQFRMKIWNEAPEFIKNGYRLLRKLSRIVFFHLLNDLNARKYRELIIERFPDFDGKTNSGVVIDLGANIGHFTHACRMLGFSVIAVEPHPTAIKYLQKRFKSDSRVRILPFAIGDANQSSTLHLHTDHSKDPIHTSISASTISDKFNSEHPVIDVETIDIKNLLASQETIRILKCDIEGAEHQIIPGIISEAQKIERILLETHLRFMNNTEDGDKYQSKLSSLNVFIKEHQLESKWLTDWV